MSLQTIEVPAKQPWSGILHVGEVLTIVDTFGQQAVDFLCFDAENKSDRYSASNTIKVQGNIYIRKGTVLYSDSGKRLFTVLEDSGVNHDTVYGCCSNANNFLRYGVQTTESCYDNFVSEIKKYGIGLEAIVPNINWFMGVPINSKGDVCVSEDTSKPGSYVQLRAECDVLAVVSNCPQIHNPCNGYHPTAVKIYIDRH